jgi:uncharacterized membrane protein YoaK (UPF0700 family)
VTPPRTLLVGLLLTATAGFVDAIGFVELRGYYASFMSGNTTQFAAALGGQFGLSIALPVGLIAQFFIGSFAGSLLAGVAGKWAPPLVALLVVAGIGVTLALSAVGLPSTQALLVLAAAMGAQNAILPQAGAARLGATFITGTLFSAAQDLARALLGTAPRWRWAQHLGVWMALLVGAAIGTLAYRNWALGALLLPAALYLALALRLAARVER